MNSHWAWALLLLFGARFLRVSPIVLLSKWHASKWTKPREVHARMRWHHTRWSHSMRSMNHASCNLHLLLIVCFLFGTLGSFSHLLKVQEAAKGICVSLCLHHSQGFFVMRSLTVNRALSYRHLLSLMIFEAFHILLILKMLELLEGMMLVMHYLHNLRFLVFSFMIGTLVDLWIHLSSWTLEVMLLDWLLSINVMRLDFKVFLIVLTILIRSSGCWTSKNAVVAGTSWLIWSDVMRVLGVEWINRMSLVVCETLVSSISFWLSVDIYLLVKLTSLSLSSSFGHTALNSVLIMSTWVIKPSTEAGRVPCTWKFEMLLAKRWYMWQLLKSCCLTFLMAIVK